MRWCDNRKEWCSEVAEGQVLRAEAAKKQKKIKKKIKGGGTTFNT